MSTTARPRADAGRRRRSAEAEGGRFAVLQRVAQGELGSLRVLIGLVLIWAIFTLATTAS